MSDDFDDIIDKIKKYFKLDSDIFNIDFLFIPESKNDLNLGPEDKKVKGFKVSYHFESGMEKPEIKVEGNIDEKRIKDFLKGMDLSKYPDLRNMYNPQTFEELDAKTLSLEFPAQDQDLEFIEPHTEINNYNDYSEIVLEIPGMNENNVRINFSEQKNEIIINAQNEKRTFVKNIHLPFICSDKDCEIEIKNGLAVIRVKKSGR